MNSRLSNNYHIFTDKRCSVSQNFFLANARKLSLNARTSVYLLSCLGTLSVHRSPGPDFRATTPTPCLFSRFETQTLRRTQPGDLAFSTRPSKCQRSLVMRNRARLGKNVEGASRSHALRDRKLHSATGQIVIRPLCGDSTMLKRIHIRGYKSLEDVEVHLSQLMSSCSGRMPRARATSWTRCNCCRNWGRAGR